MDPGSDFPLSRCTVTGVGKISSMPAKRTPTEIAKHWRHRPEPTWNPRIDERGVDVQGTSAPALTVNLGNVPEPEELTGRGAIVV